MVSTHRPCPGTVSTLAPTTPLWQHLACKQAFFHVVFLFLCPLFFLFPVPLSPFSFESGASILKNQISHKHPDSWLLLKKLRRSGNIRLSFYVTRVSLSWVTQQLPPSDRASQALVCYAPVSFLLFVWPLGICVFMSYHKVMPFESIDECMMFLG